MDTKEEYEFAGSVEGIYKHDLDRKKDIQGKYQNYKRYAVYDWHVKYGEHEQEYLQINKLKIYI